MNNVIFLIPSVHSQFCYVGKTDDLHEQRPTNDRSTYTTDKGQNCFGKSHLLPGFPDSLTYEECKEAAPNQPSPCDDEQQLFNLCSFHYKQNNT